MTIQDLLRHTSGLTYGSRGTTQIHERTRTRRVPRRARSRRRSSSPASARPRWSSSRARSGSTASRATCSAVSSRWSRASSRRLPRERIFQPLEMTDTVLGPGRQAGSSGPAAGHRSRHGQADQASRRTVAPKFEWRRRQRRPPPATTPVPPDDAQSRLARRHSPARAQDRRVHDVDHLGHDAAPARLPGPGLRLRAGLRRAPETGVANLPAPPATTAGAAASAPRSGSIRRKSWSSCP